MSTPVSTQLITRAKLSASHRISCAYGGPLVSAYAHARYAPPASVLLDKQADIQSEIDHVAGLYAKQRKFVTVRVKAGDYTLGQIVTFQYPRYGFDAGKKAMIVSITDDLIERTQLLTIWC